ncbi:MAG TPA: LLM class flavin-dependent oxidoreductase [Myxococcota bacterium]|nr:LLM class flavin-dependent oxidoreductase [Myxococcota bacterium]
MPRLPAVALAAVPGRRRATLDIARELEAKGFAGAYCASFGDALGLCGALALGTERLRFGTAIANLYTRHVSDFAQTAAFIHELSGGRFHFGVGVSHAPLNKRLGVRIGTPLADMRSFVQALGKYDQFGALPPVVVAGLRRRMVALAGEIADGVVFANAARSHMRESLSALPSAKRGDPAFFVGDMIPICISEDRAAAMARNRKTLVMYVSLPNYRNYWREAGYVEEMAAIEKAIERGERDRLTSLMSDRWLADVTLFGTAAEVREGVEAWFDAGVSTPILVPSAAAGNQVVALEELFAAFS